MSITAEAAAQSSVFNDFATAPLELKEAEAAKWLTKEQLDSVAWLPADITLIDKIRKEMS